jgi:hypothetical protein
MKLLFVLPEYGTSLRGGIATFYNHLLPGLAQAGCTIDVCLATQDHVPADLTNQSFVRVFCPDPALVAEAGAGLTQFFGRAGPASRPSSRVCGVQELQRRHRLRCC